MANVKVYYDGFVADLTKRHTEEVAFQGQTLSDLIQGLTQTYGTRFQELVLDSASGDLGMTVAVLVNGQRLELRSELRDGDEIAFLMPLAGG